MGRVFPVERPGLAEAFALGPYAGAARRAVLAYKERGRRELAGVLGKTLAAALPSLRAGPYVLVPAPSRPAAARARYGQHMTAVAHACAEALGSAVVAPVLRLSGRARDSVGLGPQARAANLRGRLRVVGACPVGSVVLLDDVITTGATAVACASALGVEVTVLAFTATA